MVAAAARLVDATPRDAVHQKLVVDGLLERGCQLNYNWCEGSYRFDCGGVRGSSLVETAEG